MIVKMVGIKLPHCFALGLISFRFDCNASTVVQTTVSDVSANKLAPERKDFSDNSRLPLPEQAQAKCTLEVSEQRRGLVHKGSFMRTYPFKERFSTPIWEPFLYHVMFGWGTPLTLHLKTTFSPTDTVLLLSSRFRTGAEDNRTNDKI